MPQNNKMFVKLTPAGEAAVWQWVQAVRKDAASLAQSAWIAQAHKQVNLCDTSFDGLYRIWLRGAVGWVTRGGVDAEGGVWGVYGHSSPRPRLPWSWPWSVGPPTRAPPGRPPANYEKE